MTKREAESALSDIEDMQAAARSAVKRWKRRLVTLSHARAALAARCK